MKKITFLLLGLIALVACEAELETQKANSVSNANRITRSSITISPEQAAAQALEFRNSILEQSGQTRGVKDKKGVASVYAWRSSEIGLNTTTRSTIAELLPDTLLYIVNFEDSCGYALVSANALVSGVAAYVERGNLSPDQEIDNPGFKLFLEGYGRFLSDSIHGISDSLLHAGDSALFGLIDTTDPGPQLYATCQIVQYVAPLLTTTWDQGRPYNNLCPVLDLEHGINCAAGCVAIAIGQVTAYYEQPTSYNGHIYNWQAIKSSESVSESNLEGACSVAELISDIGQLVNMEYSNVSGASFDSIQNCLSAFNYHYNFNGIDENDVSAIKEDLLNHHPVIVRGSKDPTSSTGHAWVIDGLIVKSYHYYRIPVTTIRKEYVHCNWGWNDVCNGYFIFKAFETLYDETTDQPVTGLNGYVVGQKCGYNYHIRAYHFVYPNE